MRLTAGIRLYQPAVLVVTLLAHGAAITSAGLVLSSRYKRKGRAIGVSICLFAMIAFGWPLFVILIGPFQSSEVLTSLSPVLVVSGILANLMARTDQFPDLAWWGTFYDIVVILLAIDSWRWQSGRSTETLSSVSRLSTPQGSTPDGTTRETVFAGD